MVVAAAASLSLSSPISLLGLRSPRSPRPRRLHLRASAAAAPSAAVAAGGTLYEVLEIGAGATGREIKAAYRRLARERHPDVARGAASAAADEFIRIHAAYATLSDPELRARYDRSMSPSSAAAAAAAAAVAAAPPRGDRRPFSSSYAAAPSFSRSGRRTWETDQCW